MEVISRLVNMQLLIQDKKSSQEAIASNDGIFTHYHKAEQIRGLVLFEQRKTPGNKNKNWTYVAGWICLSDLDIACASWVK